MKIGRRSCLSLLAATVLALISASLAQAGEQAERALAGVRGLIASGEVKRDAVLKLAFKQGNINALLGVGLELQREWEKQTGIVIAARVIPQEPARAILRDNPDIDLTVARNNEYPDLVADGLVEDLTPFVKQWNLSPAADMQSGYIRPELQSRYGDRIVAIPADGDVAVMYLRRDRLEDPKARAAFRKAYGRDLSIPRTWKEYGQLIRFFNRPEEDFHGAAEERAPGSGWMFWMLRYLPQAEPYQALFDDGMRPLIDSPAGIAATESYVAAVASSPAGITDPGKSYNFTLPLFLQGKAFSTINTIAGAKLFNGDKSAVRGKFLAVPMPGQQIGKRIVRRPTTIYGNNLVVSKRGANRKLAFLFAMWLTDPDNSTRTVGVQGGFTDPYRWHHLRDARVRELYTPQALDVAVGEWGEAIPSGTGLPGDSEYLEVLDRQIWLAAKGEITAAEAMQRTAREWNLITEKMGRDRQIEALRAFRKAALTRDKAAPGKSAARAG